MGVPDCAPYCSKLGVGPGSSPEDNRVDPCNGGGYYTVYRSNGAKEIVCKGETDVVLDLNRGNDDEDDEEVSTTVVEPEDVVPGNMCATENWNLEGNGAGYECSSNDDCMYGCCCIGQVTGRCISPFINSAFSDFLGCMPEFSVCEMNRVGLEVPSNGDPTIESEFVFGIDQCTPGNPHGRITPCCTTSADCKGIGEECCDRVRLQCVPTQTSKDIMTKIQCLDKEYSH